MVYVVLMSSNTDRNHHVWQTLRVLRDGELRYLLLFDSIQGVNAKGYGDYSDGFSPSNLATIEGEPVPGCAVADDFGNPLGNSNEAMLKAALAYPSKPRQLPCFTGKR
ncbi:MAG: hypothetical protein CM15mP120_05160 [Pseudomonadota bacterium]|nr:MAG: hypothetical protein CM15mP120_05160 [Pseudomonadota bacterium]